MPPTPEPTSPARCEPYADAHEPCTSCGDRGWLDSSEPNAEPWETEPCALCADSDARCCGCSDQITRDRIDAAFRVVEPGSELRWPFCSLECFLGHFSKELACVVAVAAYFADRAESSDRLTIPTTTQVG